MIVCRGWQGPGGVSQRVRLFYNGEVPSLFNLLFMKTRLRISSKDLSPIRSCCNQVSTPLFQHFQIQGIWLIKSAMLTGMPVAISFIPSVFSLLQNKNSKERFFLFFEDESSSLISYLLAAVCEDMNSKILDIKYFKENGYGKSNSGKQVKMKFRHSAFYIQFTMKLSGKMSDSVSPV